MTFNCLCSKMVAAILLHTTLAFVCWDGQPYLGIMPLQAIVREGYLLLNVVHRVDGHAVSGTSFAARRLGQAVALHIAEVESLGSV